MTRIAVLATAVALAAGGLSACLVPDALAAKASKRCSLHRAYRSDSTVIVYRGAAGVDDGVGNPVTVYYACLRPDGASVPIASESGGGGEYPSNDLLEQLVLAGNFAGSIMVQGLGDEAVCQKYAQPGCPTPVTVIRAADARSRRVAKISVPSGTHELVLSPSHGHRGAAAWLEPSGSGSALIGTELVPRGRGLGSAPYTLDTGAISKVRVHADTVTWLKDGVPHRARLRSAG